MSVDDDRRLPRVELLEHGFVAELREALLSLSQGQFERRLADRHPHPTQDSIARLFNRTAAQLEEKTRALEERAKEHVIAEQAAYSTLSAGVGHELNTPLAYALGNLEFVREELATIERQGDLARLLEVSEALREAEDGVRRAATIAADLERLAPHPDSAGDLERWDLRELVDSALMMIRNVVQHRARLVCHYETAPPVLVDRGRMSRVVINLVDNGLQALPSARPHTDNRIEVSVRRPVGGMVPLEVRDNGVGIPPENLGRIFDTFFTTRPGGRGTGLGLALCRRMVADLGGRIEVESAVGVGSVFRVLVPVAEPVVEP